MEIDMLNFNRVLFPIDLDNLTLSILDKALELTAQYESELHFIYVNSQQAGYRTPYEHEDQVALKIKDMVEDHSRLEDLKIVYKAARGDIDTEVLDYAHQINADIILIGQTHNTRLFELVFGSNSGKIIGNTDIPVLVLPQNKD